MTDWLTFRKENAKVTGADEWVLLRSKPITEGRLKVTGRRPARDALIPDSPTESDAAERVLSQDVEPLPTG